MPNLIQRATNATGNLLRSVLPSANRPTAVKTAGYKPLPQIWFNQPRDLPPFNFQTVRHMLLDSGIRLNLATRTAPIFGVEFAYQNGVDSQGKAQWKPGVKSKDPAVAAWVQRQLETIWHNYLPSILRAQAFGWSGGEVTLKLSEYKLIEINQLLARHPSDIRLLKRAGNRSGVRVNRVVNVGEVDLQFPYAWFHAFRPDDGEDYGNSILLGAYSPWADKWLNGGALDTRRLFMHKDAYGGMRVGYPEESLYVEGYDQPIAARDIATQIAEQRQSGGTITYPSTIDAQGNKKWVIEEAAVASNPQHILQYPKDLDDEIRTGMEIPDDVISNDGSGAWAGKRIPLAAFYASLDTWVTEILCDLRYTLEPLVMLNWGSAVDFEICHKPLALQAMEQQGNAGGQQQPGEQQPSFGQPAQQQPYRMSLNTVDAVGWGVLDAAEMVRAAKSVLRLSTQGDGPAEGDTKGENGKTYRFNRNSRWELVNLNDGWGHAGTHTSIKDMIADAKSDPSNAANLRVSFHAATEEEAAKVFSQAGVNISGYAHELQGSYVMHIEKEHGTESRSGQLPLSEEDFIRFPEVLSSFDSVQNLGKNQKGLTLLRFQKQINGHVFVVEEVRGQRTLSIVSAYKYPSKKS